MRVKGETCWGKKGRNARKARNVRKARNEASARKEALSCPPQCFD